MPNKNIRVEYLFGIPKKDFYELENLGFDIEIPNELDKSPINNIILTPDDYITIFTIYFSLKVTEEIAKEIAIKSISNINKTIKNIWNRHKNNKPAKITSRNSPEFKFPRAILSFKISETESSTIEITNELSDTDFDKLLKNQLKLVKMQYNHRKKELKLKHKTKK